MRKLILIMLVAVSAAGCYNDKYEELYPLGTVTCDTTAVSFSADIKPLLDSKCNISGCHDAGTASSGHNFTTYAGVQAAASSGRLLGSLNWTAGFSAMPKGMQKLSQCEIDKITRWMNLGMPNN